MKFHRNSITPAKPLCFDEDYDFSAFDFGPHYPLLGLTKVHAAGEVYRDDEDRLLVSLEVSATAKLSDSRTLEAFELPISFEDEFALLRSPEEEEEGYLFEENNIDLFDVVFCAIHTHLPLCPHKPGSELPTSGEGYRVLTEEELSLEPEDKPSPFDVLADFDPENE